MIVVARFAVAPGEDTSFREEAAAALAALAERPGWLRGRLGRAADDAGLWLLVTEWVGVGAYRRALGGYDVKVAAAPLLARALPEPSAFEVLYDSAGPTRGSDRA